jgi:hypothetical protein
VQTASNDADTSGSGSLTHDVLQAALDLYNKVFPPADSSTSGTTDTGKTDTGTTDTGTTDTGSTDTGKDTGKTDTGTSGTGKTDTGSTDTGTTDSGGCFSSFSSFGSCVADFFGGGSGGSHDDGGDDSLVTGSDGGGGGNGGGGGGGTTTPPPSPTIDLTVTASQATKAANSEYKFQGSIKRTAQNETSQSSLEDLQKNLSSVITNKLSVDYFCNGSVDAASTFTVPYRSFFPSQDGAEVLINQYQTITQSGTHCFWFDIDTQNVLEEKDEGNNRSTSKVFTTQ